MAHLPAYRIWRLTDCKLSVFNVESNKFLSSLFNILMSSMTAYNPDIDWITNHLWDFLFLYIDNPDSKMTFIYFYFYEILICKNHDYYGVIGKKIFFKTEIFRSFLSDMIWSYANLTCLNSKFGLVDYGFKGEELKLKNVLHFYVYVSVCYQAQ